METPLSAEKILANYKDVSRTFTYGILATIPLFFIYQLGLFFVHTQNTSAMQMINGADIGLWLVIGTMFMLYYERKIFGFIQVRIYFFFLTVPEAVCFALALGYVSLWLPFPLKPETFAETITYGAGAGFFEELLNRVFFLGGSLLLFQKLHAPERVARIIAIVITSMSFSWYHYTGPLAEPLSIGSFLYKSYAGVFFGYVYLWRGFATVAWTHALFDILPHL